MRIPTVIRLHLLATACAAALLAHGLPGQLFTPPTLAQDRTEAPTPVGWSGEGVAGTPLADMRIAYPDPHEVDQALARVETLAQVQRDWSAAEAAVDRLWLRANYAKYYDGSAPGYLQTLLRVTRASAELRAAQGKYEDALALLEVPYLHAQHPLADTPNATHTRLPVWLAKPLRDWQPDEAWRLLRADIRAGMKQEPEQGHLIPGLDEDDVAYLREHFGLPSPALWNRVEDALQRGDSPFIHSLGLRAAAALAALTLADPDGLESGHTVDPFVALASVDGPGACRMAVDYFDQEGQGFRLRVLAALEQHGTLLHESAWDWDTRDISQPPRCKARHWLDVIATLFGDPRTRSRVLELVAVAAERDALHAPLQAELGELAAQGEAAEVHTLFDALPMEIPTESMRPVLGAALEHAEAVVRTRAAEALARYTSSERLLEAMDDPSASVRTAVAHSLTHRPIPKRTFRSPRHTHSGETKYDWKSTTITEISTHAVRTLVQDSHPAVRREAAKAIAQRPWPFESVQPYLDAVAAADQEIASALTQAVIRNPKHAVAMGEALARSTDPEVVAAVDYSLQHRQNYWTDPERSAMGRAMLLIRVQDEETPFGSVALRSEQRQPASSSWALRSLIRQHLDRTTLQVQIAIEAALLAEDPEAMAELGDAGWLPSALEERSSSEVRRAAALVMTADHDEAEEFLHHVFRVMTSRDRSGIDAEGWISLLSEEGAKLTLQLQICRIIVGLGLPDSEGPVLALLRDHAKAIQAEDQTLAWARSLSYDDPHRHQGFLAQAVSQFEHAPELLLHLLTTLRFAEDPLPFARRVFDPSLHGAYASLPDHPFHLRFIEDACDLLTERGWKGEDRELLLGLLRSDVPVLYKAGSDSAQALGDPELVPVVGSILRSTTDADHQSALIAVLAASMTREAGRELVECQGAAADANVRNQILQALSNIRNYLDQKRYWETDPARETTEGEAIAELVVMLDDESPQIRTAAVLGLGSFGAREYLPRIIRMLQDEDEQVRKAARQTLGRFGVDPASLEGDGDE